MSQGGGRVFSSDGKGPWCESVAWPGCGVFSEGRRNFRGSLGLNWSWKGGRGELIASVCSGDAELVRGTAIGYFSATRRRERVWGGVRFRVPARSSPQGDVGRAKDEIGTSVTSHFGRQEASPMGRERCA